MEAWKIILVIGILLLVFGFSAFFLGYTSSISYLLVLGGFLFAVVGGVLWATKSASDEITSL